MSYDFLPRNQVREYLPLLEDLKFTHVFVPELWGRDALTQIADMMSVDTNLIFGTGIVNM